MTDRELMQQALEALSPWAGEDANHTEQYAAYHALRERLAQPYPDNFIDALMYDVAKRDSEAQRCPLCNYQHGHAIGCENNPVDIALAKMAEQPAQQQEPSMAYKVKMCPRQECASAAKCMSVACSSRAYIKPEQPAQQQDIADLIAGALGISRGTAYDMMQEALAERYAEKNSLGGPAKVFDAMADAIRAGDDYHSVLRQYGYAEAQQQEPVLCINPKVIDPATGKVRNGTGALTYSDTPCAGWSFPLYTSPPASKPLPEDYTALEQALTRLQKRYADLEGRASRPWVGLTDEDIGAACGFAEHTTASTRFALKAISRAIEAKLREKNA